MIREGVWHGTCRSIVTVCVCLVKKHLGHERYQPLATKFVVAYREIVLGLGTFKRTIQQAQQPLEQEEKHSDYKGCSRFHGRAFIQVLLYKSSFDLWGQVRYLILDFTPVITCDFSAVEAGLRDLESRFSRFSWNEGNEGIGDKNKSVIWGYGISEVWICLYSVTQCPVSGTEWCGGALSQQRLPK